MLMSIRYYNAAYNGIFAHGLNGGRNRRAHRPHPGDEPVGRVVDPGFELQRAEPVRHRRACRGRRDVGAARCRTSGGSPQFGLAVRLAAMRAVMLDGDSGPAAAGHSAFRSGADAHWARARSGA